MTLPSETVKTIYNGDGSTVAFATGFVFWEDSDVRVIHTDSSGTETVWTKGTQYTQTGGDGSTGTVTVKTTPTDYTPAVGETLTVKSALTYTQDSPLPLGGAFPSTTVETQLDKATRLVQQTIERIDRAVILPESSALAGSVSLPAPGAGKYIRWNAGGTDLEAVTGIADDSTFLQSGTGAVSYAMNTKVAQIYSVKDFGATGDGSTDDVLAVQAALDAIPSTGGAVYFPSGTYVLTTSLALTSLTKDITIYGDGIGLSVLKWTTSSCGASFTFTGTTNTFTAHDLTFMTGNAGNGTGLDVDFPSGADTTLSNYRAYNLEFRPTTLATHYWTRSLAIQYAMNAYISGVVCRGATSTVTSSIGIWVQSGCQNVLIDNCHISYSSDGIDANSVSGTKITNCYIEYVTRGVDSQASSTKNGVSVIGCRINAMAEGVLLDHYKECVIAGNLIYKHSASTSTFVGIDVQDASFNNIVYGNIIVDVGASGTATGISVADTSSTKNVVMGNFIQDCDSGIVLATGANETTVLGNRFTGCTTDYSDATTDSRAISNVQTTVAFTSIADADTTPSVKGSIVDYFKTANTGATSVTDFDDGYLGQTIHVIAGDANTTIVHNASVISLQGAANFVMGSGAILTLWKDTASTWKEIARRTA